jgi:hypothetical protein
MEQTPSADTTEGEAALPRKSQYIIRNKTASRIGIMGRETADQLVIPGLGARTVDEDLQQVFDFTPWEQLNLIEVKLKPPADDASDRGSRKTICLVYFFVVFFLGLWLVDPFAKGIPFNWGWLQWGWAGGVLALLLGAFIDNFKQSLSQTVDAGERTANILMLLLIGLGIPFFTAFHGRRLSNLWNGGAMIWADLAQAIQVLFAAFLATLPALLYFQYERQRAANVRTRFYRDAMLLNPNIQTIDDARILYGSMVEDITGTSDTLRTPVAVFGKALPVLLCTVLLEIGWTYTLITTPPNGPVNLLSYFVPQYHVVCFAFIGAYFFAINMLFRRYARSDLAPKAYSHIIIRIVCSVMLVWVFDVVFASKDTGWMLLGAFGIGVFPEAGFALLQDTLQKRIFSHHWPSLMEKHPITKLEGISLYDRVRLMEEGIESVEHLAHHDLIELMLRTRIPTPRLVDLIDQSILYIHVRDTETDDDQTGKSIEILRRYGIRTATDLLQACDAMPQPFMAAAMALPAGDPAVFNLLGAPEPGQPSRLSVIISTMRGDEWLDYLIYWRNQRRPQELVYTIEHFRPNRTRLAASPAIA